MNGTKQSVNIFSSFLDDQEELPQDGYRMPGDIPEDPEDYESLQDKKLKAETRKIDINNEKELNNLVERKMVHSILMAISQSISTNFVNLGRITSPELAAKLECPQKEREINQFLDDKIGNALENVIKTIEKMNENRVFEK